MNLKFFSDEILEQAADWYDRLDELNDAQRSDYHHWLAEDERHRAAAEYIAHYFGDSEALLLALAQPRSDTRSDSNESDSTVTNRKVTDIRTARQRLLADGSDTAWSSASVPSSAYVPVTVSELEPETETGAKRDTSTSNRFDWGLGWAAAASLLLLAPLLWFVLGTGLNSSASNEVSQAVAVDYATDTAEQQQLTLADGSDLAINANSQLSVALSDTERRVQLQQGEVFFSVARDTQRPFVISTDRGQIRVLGTAFNVDTSGDGLVVSVEHGVVEVTHEGQSWRLYAGEGVRLDGDQAQPFKDQQAGSWRTGWRKVSGEPLSDLVAHLQSHTHKQIQLRDIDGTQTFSGKYRQQDVEGTLELVTDLFGLDLQVSEQQIVISAGR
ncbi:FecR family protein [Oceanobacter kriegii]|uniref:FecR family protein n=1 Tax=Oceanobacter kriegii TaxID=64972 RepID=UPI0004018BBE|nr:FecR family protein [Oceanobacter kriegii]